MGETVSDEDTSECCGEPRDRARVVGTVHSPNRFLETYRRYREGKSKSMLIFGGRQRKSALVEHCSERLISALEDARAAASDGLQAVREFLEALGARPSDQLVAQTLARLTPVAEPVTEPQQPVYRVPNLEQANETHGVHDGSLVRFCSLSLSLSGPKRGGCF